MKAKLKNILLLAYSMAQKEIDFSETEKRVFKEFMQALKLDSDDFLGLKDQDDNPVQFESLTTKEEKTLLLDILLLLSLSQGNIGQQQVMFLLKSMRQIKIASSDYTIFSLSISFDEFLKRKDINLDNLYRMLWTKVAHVMRKQIFIPQWSKSLSCSISSIDKQHKALIDHFAAYVIKLQMDRSAPEIKKMLSFLQNYANEHFKTEETLMRQADYAFIETHLKAHQHFKTMFANLLESFKTDKNLSALRDGLSDWLIWFLKHIRETDLPSCFHIKIKQASTLRKNQILICHDGKEKAATLSEKLTHLGIERIVLTENEKEAWDWIQTGDIALVVIYSAGKLFKGIDLLSRIRKNDKKIAVLLIPESSNQNDLSASIKRGKLVHPLNFTLVNPFDQVDLIQILHTTLLGA